MCRIFVVNVILQVLPPTPYSVCSVQLQKLHPQKKQLQKKLFWQISRHAGIGLSGPGFTPQPNLQVKSNKWILCEVERETGIVALLKLQGGYWLWLSYKLTKA